MNAHFPIKVMHNKTIMKSGFYREKYLPSIFGFCLWEGGVCLQEGGGGGSASNNFFIKKCQTTNQKQINKLLSPLH